MSRFLGLTHQSGEPGDFCSKVDRFYQMAQQVASLTRFRPQQMVRDLYSPIVKGGVGQLRPDIALLW